MFWYQYGFKTCIEHPKDSFHAIYHDFEQFKRILIGVQRCDIANWRIPKIWKISSKWRGTNFQFSFQFFWFESQFFSEKERFDWFRWNCCVNCRFWSTSNHGQNDTWQKIFNTNRFHVKFHWAAFRCALTPTINAQDRGRGGHWFLKHCPGQRGATLVTVHSSSKPQVTQSVWLKVKSNQLISTRGGHCLLKHCPGQRVCDSCDCSK